MHLPIHSIFIITQYLIFIIQYILFITIFYYFYCGNSLATIKVIKNSNNLNKS